MDDLAAVPDVVLVVVTQGSVRSYVSASVVVCKRGYSWLTTVVDLHSTPTREINVSQVVVTIEKAKCVCVRLCRV